MNGKLNLDQYAMRLAETAALRSEDPFHKVGAVALSKEGRVLGTGYNGLPAGVNADPSWWENPEAHDGFILHAEQNLCALLYHGEAHTVAVTLYPCTSCFRLLVAHGVKRILYKEIHPQKKEVNAFLLADFYGNVELIHFDV